MKIALAQVNSLPGKKEHNLQLVENWSSKAAEQKADLVLFHEGTLTDFVPNPSELAEKVPNGPSTQRIIGLSKELNLHISFGLIEQEQDRLFITQVFVGPQGLIYKYQKSNLHVPENPEKAAKRFRDEVNYFTPGNKPQIFKILGKKAACIICADGNSPNVLAHVATLKPELVFYPNNRVRWRDDEYWGAIAKEVKAPLFISNRVGESWGFSSQGGASAYDSDGQLISQAELNGKENMIIVEWPLT